MWGRSPVQCLQHGQTALIRSPQPTKSAIRLASTTGAANMMETKSAVVFPIQHGGIGGVGIDIDNYSVVPLDPSASPPHAHDFMVTFVNGQFKWVSWFTYGVLVEHSRFGSYDASDPPMLVVSGRISPAEVATLRPLYKINVAKLPLEPLVEDDSESIYTIRAYDARGNTIYLKNFEAEKRENHTIKHLHGYSFAEVIPVLPGLQRIAVFKHGRLLGELVTKSPSLPVKAEMISPRAGAMWARGSRRIEWTLRGIQTKSPVLMTLLTEGPGQF